MTLKYFPFSKKRYIFSLMDIDIAHDAALSFGKESVFFTEHEGIYSAGKSFEPKEFLKPPLLPTYFPNRGGKTTVHSKGQLVIYPIINLKKRNLNVSDFIEILEKWIIDALLEFGIRANSSNEGRGVWVSDKKIGFIGISVIKGVSKHGLCLNVSNDLGYFDNIIPCGIKNAKITSIEKIANKTYDLERVSEIFKNKSPF